MLQTTSRAEFAAGSSSRRCRRRSRPAARRRAVRALVVAAALSATAELFPRAVAHTCSVVGGENADVGGSEIAPEGTFVRQQQFGGADGGDGDGDGTNPPPMGETNQLPKIGGMLSSLYAEKVQGQQGQQQQQQQQQGVFKTDPFMPKGDEKDDDKEKGKPESTSSSYFDEFLILRDGTHVLIETVLVAGGEGDALRVDCLLPLGFEETASYGRLVSGYVPIASLPGLSECDLMQFAFPAVRYMTNAGSVESEGVMSMLSDVARDKYGADGEGITVGVISDTFNCTQGADLDIESGDLPPSEEMLILDDICDPFFSSDEGRAMMQLIHDVAPGAKLAFHSVGNSMSSFAQAILNLATVAKADVIVDDIGFFREPMFQDGIIAQAVDEVKSMGVPYFCAAGNMGMNSWESSAGFVNSGFVASVIGDFPLHDFTTRVGVPNPSRDLVQEVVVPSFWGVAQLAMSFQWDEPTASAVPLNDGPFPPKGSASNLALIVWDIENDFELLWDLRNDDNNLGNDPVELIFVNVPAEGPSVRLGISIALIAGPPPTFMKYTIWRPGGSTPAVIRTYPTPSGTCIGHAYASGGAGIAAAAWTRTPAYGISPPLNEMFSSPCGIPVIFDVNGDRLGEREYRRAPRVTGPDGTRTTFFGAELVEGEFYFSGTSAAAPHVAAVAALMLQASGGRLGPSEVYDILEETSTDMGVAGFDYVTGHGLVNAELAVGRAVQKRFTRAPRRAQLVRMANNATAGATGAAGNFEESKKRKHRIKSVKPKKR